MKKFEQILEQGYNNLTNQQQPKPPLAPNATAQPNTTDPNAQAQTNQPNQQPTAQTVPSIAEFQKALQTNDVNSVNKMFASADDATKNAITNLQYDPQQKKFVLMKPQGAM